MVNITLHLYQISTPISQEKGDKHPRPEITDRTMVREGDKHPRSRDN